MKKEGEKGEKILDGREERERPCSILRISSIDVLEVKEATHGLNSALKGSHFINSWSPWKYAPTKYKMR